MKNSIINGKMYWLASVCIVALLYISGCKPEKYPITTNPTLNAIQYFENNPDFSLFDQALEKTGYAGFLGAYGAYTVFAPNNTAITAYLKTINKSGIDQVDVNVLQAFVSIHIIQDTLSTNNFTDGKLPTPTMYGQFITTGAALINGAATYTVNKQANVIQPNIRVGNGIIHTIDHVLSPATATIAQIIAANPKYSIFSQALTATGYYDTLNVVPANSPKRPFLTLIAQTDSVFNAAGISSFADLKAKYSTTGNPKNPNDSLFLYVAYRIIPSLQYLGDIVSSPSLTTLAPQENISVQLSGGTVLLNQVVFNGITETGVPLDRTLGDVAASNGVIQSVKTNFKYKVRAPTPVYFDITDQPELRKLTSIFRRPSQSSIISLGQVAAYNWDTKVAGYLGPNYFNDGNPPTNVYVFGDGLGITLRVSTSAPQWFETKTPLIVKGVYKVWICFRSASPGKYTQITVDGQPLARIVDLTANLPSTTQTTAQLEAQGFKRYTNSPATNNKQVGELAGVVTINTTDIHTVRFTCIKDFSNGTNNVTLDMIQFIPTSMSQTDKLIDNKTGAVIPNPNP